MIKLYSSVKKDIIICLDIGHNVPMDTGAIYKQIQEDKLISAVGSRLYNLLTAVGFKVIQTNAIHASSTSESLKSRVETSNKNNSDLFISIHANKSEPSLKAMGAEVWCYGQTKLSKIVVDAITSLGFKSRGVKIAGVDGSNLSVLKNTIAPAILIELCFIDSEADMLTFNKVGADLIALKITEAILNHFSL